MIMRRFVACLPGCALPLLALLSGCAQKPSTTVGVVPKGANHIFWQSVHAGAVKAGRENGLQIEWNAPALEIDASRQIAIVDSMINRRLAGIAIAPVDRKALVGPVERAMNLGIPVTVFDSGLDTKQRISFVATDNREGGKMAARELAALTGEKGKVAVIGFQPGSASTMEREEGFIDELKRFPSMLVVQTVYAAASQAKAMASTENILNAHPDLAGIFADNESSSVGASQALKARGKRKAKLVAFDASEALIQDLRDGHIDALVVQDPFKMGYEAARTIAMKIKGETPAADIDSGARLIRGTDLEAPEVKALLFPDLKSYLN